MTVVSKWFKSSRSRRAHSLHRDQPFVRVLEKSPARPLSVSGVTSSVYQYSAIHRDTVLFHHNPTTEVLHFVLLEIEPKRHSVVVDRLAQACWLESFASIEKAATVKSSMIEFLSQFYSSLFEVAKGSIPTQHMALVIPLQDKNFYTSVTGSFLVAQVSKNNEILFLNHNEGKNIALSENSSKIHFDKTSRHETKALIVLQGTASVAVFLKGIQAILACPYPKVGAAELLHFALIEQGIKSNVMWMEFD